MKIISTEHLLDDIISMWIEAPDIAKKADAGQFISIYSDSKSESFFQGQSVYAIQMEKMR